MKQISNGRQNIDLYVVESLSLRFLDMGVPLGDSRSVTYGNAHWTHCISSTDQSNFCISMVFSRCDTRSRGGRY